MNFRNTYRLRQLTLAVAMGLGLSGVAFSQQTAGDISGTATYAAGEMVVIKSVDSGLTRSVSVNADGKFRVPALPSGRYEISLVQDGKTVASSTTTVVAGQTAQVALGASEAAATSLTSVTVTANALPAIDVSTVETRTTFSAQQLNQLPVPRDAVSVALLAPGAVKGNAIFGNLPSFGGSSVAENSYYVNGFNVTNLYNNLSFGQVPFQAIDQMDVQTGGYGAQFGFSTGGVTSVNIKRGTNEWKGGVSWTTAPNALRSQPPTVYRSNGSTYRYYDDNSATTNTYTAWMGGPLVKDKLFIFALGDFTKGTGTTYGGASQTSTRNSLTGASGYDYSLKSPYWVVKVDWNITDSNHLEYTGFNNTDNTKYNYYSVNYTDGLPSKARYQGDLHTKYGGQTHVLKYTGYLTDDLTLTAQYGRMESNNSSYTVSASGITSRYNGDINAPASGCPWVAYNGAPWGATTCAITSSVDVYGGMDTRKAGRFDLEWKLGSHTLGGGYSDERWSSDAGTSYAGGAYHYYYTQPTPTDPGLVITYNFRTGGAVDVRQKSWYVEDHWLITDRFMLYGGIRNDNFNNKNGAGETFVKQDNIWQPRLGFSWDINGDSSLKLYGTAGRYSLPMAANVALRAATASLYTEDDSLYSGINPDGTPIIVGEFGGEGHYVYNGEDGSTPNPKAVASKKLKPYVQDEYILGVQKLLTSDISFFDNWTVGAKATYRKLRNTIDDTCDSRPFYNLAQQNGVGDAWPDEWTVPDGMGGCWIFNPGSALKLTTTLDGTSKTFDVTIPGNQLGPAAKRSYQGIELTAEKTTDKYYVNASYTWARSYGNTEGLVKSNNGQDDTGTTADFDFPEIMKGANGYLPNDRRHTFKLYGAWKFTPEWSVGANMLVQSGTPISCYGGGGGTLDTHFGYSGQWHVCNGKVSPEGGSGRTPWVWTFSPNVMYSPAWAKGLSMQLSVINLFNNDTETFVFEQSEGISNGGARTVYTNYKLPKYFNTPRYARFQVQYDFSL
ncbi:MULTISPECIES: TonB-dependent receptor [Dyella]|uniref:TonB-dependent receptor n=2 Tax=Dyella TaxID=231454 RepID=A0A4R0YGI0_9GAMM|nr:MULTISPECIES: TonB-dependent receptor [Dyella]TBR36023.1 TonB-dependent receptor [Dyella terrae]TCI06072.1 TonB-dependent receptor [Dyella soli]